MRAAGMRFPDHVGACVNVVGATEQEERRMRRLRDELADAMNVREVKGHGAYGFHITPGYWLRWPDEDEVVAFVEEMNGVLDVAFELGDVEFCTLEDILGCYILGMRRIRG